MTFKAILLGGLLAAGLGLSLGVGAADADAKTRVHLGIGIGSPYFYGHPYYGRRCVNPGWLDWCGAGIYRGFDDDPFFWPRYRYRYSQPYHHRHRVANRCDEAARAIRNAGYHDIRATDCNGRFYGFRASKRGVRHTLRVDNRTGRISVAR